MTDVVSQFQELNAIILANDDDEIIANKIDEIANRFGAKAFRETYELVEVAIAITINDEKNIINGYMIHSFAIKDKHKSIQALSRTGIDLDALTKDDKLSFTPLMYAIITKKPNSVRALLQSGASLEKTVLAAMKVNLDLFFDAEITCLLTTYQIEPDYVEAILSRLEAMDTINPDDIRSVIPTVVSLILNLGLKDEKWMAILKRMKLLVGKHSHFLYDQATPLKLHETNLCFSNDTSVPSLDDAIDRANSYCLNLLTDSKSCIPLLQEIERDFKRYFQETHPDCNLPYVAKDQYQFKVLDCTEFPIPESNSHYLDNNPKHIEKFSALKEFMLLVMRAHGMGDQAIRWVGFIGENEIKSATENGDMMLESNATGQPVYHGVYSHMLQTLVLLYGMKHKIIPLTYQVNDTIINLTAKQILAFHGRSNPSTNKLFWTGIRDERDLTKIVFTDPYRIFSFIMRYGDQFELTTLSHYLIDSCCKAQAKLFKAFRTRHDQFYNFREFSDIHTQVRTQTVLTFQTLINDAIAKYKARPSCVSIFKDNNPKRKFDVVKVCYTPNPHFKL